jgi:hypothetical protein
MLLETVPAQLSLISEICNMNMADARIVKQELCFSNYFRRQRKVESFLRKEKQIADFRVLWIDMVLANKTLVLKFPVLIHHCLYCCDVLIIIIQ